MRAFVFTDGALAKHAGRFVWLSIDTEKDENAAFVAKYPIDSWPTLFVVDPSSEKPVMKWLGSATVPQLERLFDDGERAFKGGSSDALEQQLAEADRAGAAGNPTEAAAKFEALVSAAPQDWPRRSRA